MTSLRGCLSLDLKSTRQRLSQSETQIKESAIFRLISKTEQVSHQQGISQQNLVIFM